MSVTTNSCYALGICRISLVCCCSNNRRRVYKKLAAFVFAHNNKIAHFCDNCAGTCACTENNRNVRYNTGNTSNGSHNFTNCSLGKYPFLKSCAVRIKHCNNGCTHFCCHIINFANLLCVHFTNATTNNSGVLRISECESAVDCTVTGYNAVSCGLFSASRNKRIKFNKTAIVEESFYSLACKHFT